MTTRAVFRRRNSSVALAQIPSLCALWDANLGAVKGCSAEFTRANSEYLSIADNAALSMGAGVRFTIAGWYYPTVDAPAGSHHGILTKWWYTGNKREYMVYLNHSGANSTYSFAVSADGTTPTILSTGTITLNQWVFICCTYDGANISISLNNGTPATAAYSADVNDNVSTLLIGAMDGGGTPDRFADARMASWGIWKRVLTAGEITSLYNSGAGRLYTDLSTSDKVSLQAWWDLGEGSDGTGAVTRNDSHGTNHLTDNNTVASNEGLIVSTCGDGDPVTRWRNQVGLGTTYDLTQTTHTTKPVWKPNIFGSNAGIYFVTDDVMINAALGALLAGADKAMTIVAALKMTAVAANNGIACICENSTGVPYRCLKAINDGVTWQMYNRDDSSSGKTYNASGTVNTDACVVAAQWGGDTFLGKFARNSKALDAGGDQDVGTLTSTRFVAGASRKYGAVAPLEPLSGHIGLLMVFNAALTQAQLNTAVAYAAQWAGVTV
jgi:hypothetical protein